MHEMTTIPIKQIRLSMTEGQVARRGSFDKIQLAELTGSIAAHGILQPIIVRLSKGVRYEYQLVAGERRVMAAADAKLDQIPAIVRDLTDEQVIEVQLIENLQRQDLHPMHEAEGYNELMEKHGHEIQELYERVGKSRSYVYGRLKLLALCQPVRNAFYADKISASVALLIARIPVDKLQREALSNVSGQYNSVSYRRAQEIIQDRYMLHLKGATFSPKDAERKKRSIKPLREGPRLDSDWSEPYLRACGIFSAFELAIRECGFGNWPDAGSLARSLAPDEAEKIRQRVLKMTEWLDEFEQHLQAAVSKGR